MTLLRRLWEFVLDSITPQPGRNLTTREVRDLFWRGVIGGSGDLDLDKVVYRNFDEWLAEVRAEAWQEGFEAGEQDVLTHEAAGDWDAPCVPNPYHHENGAQQHEGEM